MFVSDDDDGEEEEEEEAAEAEDHLRGTGPCG